MSFWSFLYRLTHLGGDDEVVEKGSIEERIICGGGVMNTSVVMDTKDLIEYIAKALVDHPEQVEVSEIEGERGSVIKLSVAKGDMGRVIGKQGRTGEAIRTILGLSPEN